MVFPSIPAYLDPSNWQQNHQIIGSTSANPNPLFPPPPPHGSIRPGSMSERARLANIPMPETALKCPRCESTNTKFCYFNNYSLSQPRHFCKTCRRYWTRGGALRNVPVGGGCRRNKRSKSKSPASSERQQISNPTSSTAVSTRFVSPLSQLNDNYSDMGLNYTVVGSNETNLIEPWRVPFLGGLESYQFHQGGGFMGGETSSDVRPKLLVKMEDRHPERQLLGDQWNPVNWTDLSTFTSSSSTTNNNPPLYKP